MPQPLARCFLTWGILALGAFGCAAAKDPAGARQTAASGSSLVAHDLTGDALPRNTLSLTFDDGPDAYTLALAQFLAEREIKATFFVNGCRFAGAPAPVPETGNCTEPGRHPRDLLGRLVALGHRVANHTEDHVDLVSHPALAVSQLSALQALLAPYVQDDLYLFRAPYNLWSAGLTLAVRSAPTLRALKGPFYSDVDGADWACARDGRTPEQCADQYLAALADRPARNGIVLLHDRNEFCVGCDYTLRLLKVLLTKLPPDEYRYVPLDAIPGVRAEQRSTR